MSISMNKRNNMTINEVMEAMPEEWRYHWCRARVCACRGCANHRVRKAGFTEVDWKGWVKKNER